MLNDMFVKRKTVSIRYDDAVDTLGDEAKVDRLIKFGIIDQIGDRLELDESYLRFFEEVLEVNEDINVEAINTYISKLRLSINSYLALDSNDRKIKLLREIRHIFRSIGLAASRNVADLRRNVDVTYKQEPNFKIKELRLKDFDEKRLQISTLIHQTEKIIDEQSVFFATAGTDVMLYDTISELKEQLRDSAHALIDISATIIDYLNRIEYESKLVKKVRQLKYLRDMLLINSSTDIEAVAANINDVCLEPRPQYTTLVSIDFLHNDDAAIPILDNIRQRLHRKNTFRERLASPIEATFFNEEPEQQRAFDHRQIFDSFHAQSLDLFSYVWRYQFSVPTTTEERLVLFLQLASQYDEQLLFTDQIGHEANIEYPIILPA